jgi:hypothetical protein
LRLDLKEIYIFEIYGENIKILANDNLDYFELKNHKPWFVKGAQNY